MDEKEYNIYYCNKNKEKIAKQKKEYRLKNIDKIKILSKIYRDIKENREKRKANESKFNHESSSFTTEFMLVKK